MDFFLRNFEAAQQQARTLTLSASQSAKGLAEQLTEHTKSFAEQAATVSSAAAEQASQRWKGLNLQETLQLKALQQHSAQQAGPPSQALEQFAISPDFKEFIRSLTYSTFRDFPLDQLPNLDEAEGAKVLTPWQEKHALLVVQEVKEINELRFVLCPKRMTDSQFWQVYFSLARKYLPAEAFDKDFQLPDDIAATSRVGDLQSGFKRTFETARETARDWSSRASGTLRPAETSAQLHDLVESRSRGTTPKAAEPEASLRQAFADSSPKPAPEDLDNELEAYLQTITDAEPSEGADPQAVDVAESEEAEDLDQYLSELTKGEGEGEKTEEGSEDAIDLEQYMQELQEGGQRE